MPIFAISLSKPNDAADDADRADDRVRIGDDLVGRAGDHVAAGGAGVFDEGDDLTLFLLRQFADAAEDQVRLHRRSARRVDRERDGRGAAHGERALERAGDAGERQARPQRRRKSDNAGQAHHRHDRTVAAKTPRNERTQRADGAAAKVSDALCSSTGSVMQIQI